MKFFDLLIKSIRWFVKNQYGIIGIIGAIAVSALVVMAILGARLIERDREACEAGGGVLVRAVTDSGHACIQGARTTVVR